MTAINPRHSSFKLAILFALIHSVYPFLTPTTAATISSSFSTTTSYSSRSVTSISTPSTDNTLSSALAMSDSSQNQNDNISQGQTIGFIGCGTIASAIATGLLTQQNPDHIIHKVYVTKRSEAKSAALSNRFGQKIVVTEDNQNIVDHSDILFLCVLPQHEESVLKALDIPHDKTLISLIVSLFVVLYVHLNLIYLQPSRLVFHPPCAINRSRTIMDHCLLCNVNFSPILSKHVSRHRNYLLSSKIQNYHPPTSTK